MPLVTRTRATRPQISRGRTLLNRGVDAYAFLLGCTTVFSIHIIGDLYWSEILLLLAFPLLVIMRGRRALRPELKILYALMGLWLVGLIVADAYNGTVWVDRIRGMSLILFFAVNLLGMSILLGGQEKRKLLYLVGLMVGALVSVRLQPSEAVAAYPWKFGYAWGTIQLVMLVSSYFYARGRYVVSILLVLGICAVNLLLNFRSPVLDLLVTLVLVFPIVPESLGGMQILPRSQSLRLLVLAVFAFGAAEMAGALVSFVTHAGYIDEESRAKNEAQEKGGSLLFGGRPEFLIGLKAAFDSPIIGHGSWAKDAKYYEMLYDAQVEAGTIEPQVGGDILSDEGNPLIPGHSAIITSWVWAGIAGLIFWLYVLWFSLRGMMWLAVLKPPLAPYLMWFLISTWWDIFFSPFAANRRIIEAVMLVIVADLLRTKIVVAPIGWRRLGAVRPIPSFAQRSTLTSPIRSR